jgi:hypothetical protein
VDLEGHLEGASVPLHRLLKRCIENRQGSGLKASMLKLEIYNSRWYDLDDNCRFIHHAVEVVRIFSSDTNFSPRRG